MATLGKMEKIFKVFYSKSGHVELPEVQLACSYLNNNGVIALPTDTLYGIAARVDNSEALDRIYKIKGRDANKPLAVCLAGVEQMDQVVDMEKVDMSVIRSLLPGPLTLVLKRSTKLNKNLNPQIANVGIRIPDHNFIRAICDTTKCPLALTSANKSGETSPLKVEDFEDIWDNLDAVFDMGILRISLPVKDSQIIQKLRLGSTVVDMTKEREYRILREGCGLNRTINVLNRFGFRRRN